MKKLDKRLLRMIKNSKGQYLAILSIVITGLFTFTAINNGAINLKSTLEYFYEESNFADINVTLISAPKDIEEEFPGKYNIKEAEGRVVVDVPFITDEENERVATRIISVDSKENRINKLYIKEGSRQIKGKEVIVIDQFARARNINIDDKVKLQINGVQYDFTVKGIAASSEFVYLMENEQNLLPKPDKFGVIYIEETFVQRAVGMNGSYNELLFSLNQNKDIKKTIDNIKEELDKYGVKRTTKREDQLSNSVVHEEIKGLEKTSRSVPIIFLAVAALILSAMVNRTVKKDRTSIGILKALGYTNREIIFHYTKYSLSIGIIGGTIGTILGTILSGAMTQIYVQYFNIPMLQIKLYPQFIFTAIFLSSVFCIAAGLWGAKGILNISPAESMKPEPPKTGKRIALEKVRFIWNKVSFTWKIVIRNIFREKKKFIFISLAAALTYSMMLMTFWMGDIFNGLFDIHYGQFMKMDYSINFMKPTNINAVNDLRHIIDAEAIEPKVEFPFELKNGVNTNVVNIVGLESNTVFYEFKDLNGKEVELPNEGMIISSNLASSLGVEKGDNILVHNFIPNREDAYIKVIDIIDQNLGINGYMNINYMNRVLTEKGMVSGVYINSQDNIIEKLQDVKNISSIQSQKDMKNMFYEFIDLMIIAIAVMIIFSALLGFVIIYSMTVMSINERTLEFSSLRVLGFTKQEIFKIILKENAIMTVVGIIYGIPMGIAEIKYIGDIFSSDLYTLNEPVTFKAMLYALIFTIICLIFAQIVTYKKINNLDFIQALKNRVT